MKKASVLSKKIAKFLEKASFLHSKGYHRAINFEVNGKRCRGEALEDFSCEKESIKFSFKGESFEFSKEDIKKVKRLRTKKYLFTVEGKKAPKKAEAPKEEEEEVKETKPKKKAKKKTTTKDKE